MVHVRVVSKHYALAVIVAQHLGERGLVAKPRLGSPTRCVLRVRESLDAEAREAILQQLLPFVPLVERVGADALDATTITGSDPTDAEIQLGAPAGFDKVNVRLVTDELGFGNRLRSGLTECGFDVPQARLRISARSMMRFGGAPPFARQAIRFLLARHGVDVVEIKAWPSSDMDLWLDLLDPAQQALPVRSRYPVRLGTDLPRAVEPLVANLNALGFTTTVAPLATPLEGQPHRFTCGFHSLAELGDDEAMADVAAALGTMVSHADVDANLHPLVEAPVEGSLGPVLNLPLAEHAAGRMRPYGTSAAARFPVVVVTDDPERAQGLVARIEALGFVGTRIEPFGDDRLPSVRIQSGKLQTEASLLYEALKGALEEEATKSSADGEPLPLEERSLAAEDERAVLWLPAAALADGSAKRRLLGELHRWNLVLQMRRGDPEPSALVRDLKNAGFLRVTCSPSMPSDDAALKYGGAPDVVLARIKDVLARHTPETFEPIQEWTEDDLDIFVALPERFLARGDAQTHALHAEELPDLASWIEPTRALAVRSLLERSRDDAGRQILRFADRELTVRPGPKHPLAPTINEFAHFCLDGSTAQTILHLIDAVTMREPCLLEGETSTAKTSTVLYLAAQLEQPVLRANLHGQSDTGELVGRYVPDESSEGWRWQEGLVLRALREGLWLLFDELNLAEPQLLERFNSLLEREPSLIVHEHQGERIAGADIHPDFRIFATMNPAEYAGRSAMSPAWRDRFRAHRVAPSPGETEIKAFLEYAVHGVAPVIALAGHQWVPSKVADGAWSALACVPNLEPFLSALARFHVSLERSLAASDPPGRGRRDRYVVTRRNLLSVLDWLVARGGSEKSMREALVRYYVERIALADRGHVLRLLDAAGIGPRTWLLDGSRPGPATRPGPTTDLSSGVEAT